MVSGGSVTSGGSNEPKLGASNVTTQGVAAAAPSTMSATAAITPARTSPGLAPSLPAIAPAY